MTLPLRYKTASNHILSFISLCNIDLFLIACIYMNMCQCLDLAFHIRNQKKTSVGKVGKFDKGRNKYSSREENF